MYYYTFDQGINGFAGADTEIFKQPWIYISNCLEPLKDALKTDQFSKTSGTYDDFKRTLEDISKDVEKQGIFYTKATGEPNYNGAVMKRNIEEAASKTLEYKNLQNKMDISLLKSAMIKYNDNLEKAMIEVILRIIKNACAQYNSYGIEVDGKKDTIDYTNILSNKTFTSLKQLESSQIIQELNKSPRNEYIKVTIPERPEETMKETK